MRDLVLGAWLFDLSAEPVWFGAKEPVSASGPWRSTRSEMTRNPDSAQIPLRLAAAESVRPIAPLIPELAWKPACARRACSKPCALHELPTVPWLAILVWVHRASWAGKNTGQTSDTCGARAEGCLVAADPIPPPHRLPRVHFEEFCRGGGSAAAVRELWRSELSRRMLLIRAVTQAALVAHLGPLPSVEEAWDALATAEGAAREAARAVLLWPQIGNWAAYTMRRHRGRVAADTPIWLDFGLLHTVALLASAKAELSWRTRLPVRDRRLMLPGVGMALLPDAAPHADFAEAWTEGGVIRLRHAGRTLVVPVTAAPCPSAVEVPDDPPGWLSLRCLRLDGPNPFTLVIDDLDPFRNLAEPVPPERLVQPEFDVWGSTLKGAWDLLCREQPDTAEAAAEALVCLVPLPDDGWGTRSASTGESFGSILVSPAADEVSLAVALVHEFQHTKLGGLMHLNPICQFDEQIHYYAPWRDDPRPMSGLLQGVYAFIGIAAFWRAHRCATLGAERLKADFEYAYACNQVESALSIIARSSGLTAWGEMLLASLRARVRLWLSETIDEAAVHAAALLARVHRAGWLIRHGELPPPERIIALAEAFAVSNCTSTAASESLPVRFAPSRLRNLLKTIAGHSLDPLSFVRCFPRRALHCLRSCAFRA